MKDIFILFLILIGTFPEEMLLCWNSSSRKGSTYKNLVLGYCLTWDTTIILEIEIRPKENVALKNLYWDSQWLQQACQKLSYKPVTWELLKGLPSCSGLICRIWTCPGNIWEYFQPLAIVSGLPIDCQCQNIQMQPKIWFHYLLVLYMPHSLQKGKIA